MWERFFVLWERAPRARIRFTRPFWRGEDLGLRRIVSCTTRPIRAGEADGVEYHFCTEEERDRLLATGRVIEMRSYDTCEGRWDYFTVADDRLI